MALYRKWTSTILVNGQPEPNVKVYVFSPGSTDQIPIYEDEGVTPITQPILTDSQGRYAFFVDVDTYPEIRLYLEKDGVDFSEANEDLDGVPVPGAGAGAGTFLELTDTPSSYVGRGGDVVLVKTTEDGIETQPWPVTGTILNFFLSDDAADIGSYYYMYPTESGNGYSELTSPSLSTGDDQLLWAFVTEAGEPGVEVLALGAYTTTLFLKKTGNKDVRLYWKLFKRDTGGTETEILQSAVSDYLTADNSQYLISGYLNEDQTLDPTDRLVLKLYANVSGTGTDVTVTLTMEGDYDSRLTINVLSSAFNLDRLSDVTISSPSNDEVLAYDSGSGKWLNKAPTFLKLADTPSSFAGKAGYSPVVNSAETALEFAKTGKVTTSDVTIYVDAATGSDASGDGTAANPYATLGKALDHIREHFPTILHTVTIAINSDDTITETPDWSGIAVLGELVLEARGLDDSPKWKARTENDVSVSGTSLQKTGEWTGEDWNGALVFLVRTYDGGDGGTGAYGTVSNTSADSLTVSAWNNRTPSGSDNNYVICGVKLTLSGAQLFSQGDIRNVTIRGLVIDADSNSSIYVPPFSSVKLENCFVKTTGWNPVYVTGQSSLETSNAYLWGTVDYRPATVRYGAHMLAVNTVFWGTTWGLEVSFAATVRAYHGPTFYGTSETAHVYGNAVLDIPTAGHYTELGGGSFTTASGGQII